MNVALEELLLQAMRNQQLLFLIGGGRRNYGRLLPCTDLFSPVHRWLVDFM